MHIKMCINAHKNVHVRVKNLLESTSILKYGMIPPPNIPDSNFADPRNNLLLPIPGDILSFHLLCSENHHLFMARILYFLIFLSNFFYCIFILIELFLTTFTIKSSKSNIISFSFIKIIFFN